MKRRIVAILLFLLAGVVMNVAVAWGCAMWVHYDPRINTMDDVLGFSADTGPAWSYRVRDGRFGAVQVEATRVGVTYRPREEAWAMISARLEELPRWSRARQAPPLTPLRPSFFEQARGWPRVSLRCSFSGTVGIGGFTVEDGIRVRSHPDPHSARFQSVALPLRPIWPGFTLNTLTYGAALYLLFFGGVALRRQIRRKRGRCIKCGYDLRGDLGAGCPECGWKREEAEA